MLGGSGVIFGGGDYNPHYADSWGSTPPTYMCCSQPSLLGKKPNKPFSGLFMPGSRMQSCDNCGCRFCGGWSSDRKTSWSSCSGSLLYNPCLLGKTYYQYDYATVMTIARFRPKRVTSARSTVSFFTFLTRYGL